MHDSLTVAFEIRRPWPRVDTWKAEQAARTGIRWVFGATPEHLARARELAAIPIGARRSGRG